MAEQLAWVVWSDRQNGGYAEETIAAAKSVIDGQKVGPFGPSNSLIADALNVYLNTRNGVPPGDAARSGEGGGMPHA
ncbi:MAG TPA: hypothetical protein VHQ47_08960 [Phycisphaerae bacterium]|nr:hypothetical protein [Phycisphaerae bacterium]